MDRGSRQLRANLRHGDADATTSTVDVAAACPPDQELDTPADHALPTLAPTGQRHGDEEPLMEIQPPTSAPVPNDEADGSAPATEQPRGDGPRRNRKPLSAAQRADKTRRQKERREEERKAATAANPPPVLTDEQRKALKERKHREYLKRKAAAISEDTCAECQVGEDGSGIAGVATVATPIEVAPFSGHNMQGEGRANFERALNGGQSR